MYLPRSGANAPRRGELPPCRNSFRRRAMADDPKHPALSRESFESGALKDHTRVLYRFAVKVVRDPALAEDLVQETFLAALAGAGNRFAGRSSVRTWLTGILKHKIADALRERASAPLSY